MPILVYLSQISQVLDYKISITLLIQMYGTGFSDPFAKIVKSGDNRFPCPGFISGDADFVGNVSYNVSSISNKFR